MEIKLDDRRLGTGTVDHSIVVDLWSAPLDSATQGDHPQLVGDGRRPGAETPTGRFAITDTFRGGLNPAYGCCAVALTASQPQLPSGWLGGDRIAIHGTTRAARRGRLTRLRPQPPDGDVAFLVDEAPLGTPVRIRE